MPLRLPVRARPDARITTRPGAQKRAGKFGRGIGISTTIKKVHAPVALCDDARVLPNIVLIGFMGCGKSSVGRRLAHLAGHRFVDSDELVTQSENCSIAEIFAKGGEETFRDAESKALSGLVGVEGIVLATGGGAILRETNRAVLRRIGIVAWLDADPDILFARATRTNRRPLLQTENPRATFDALLAARREIYELAADFHFDSTRFGHDEVAKRLLDQALEIQSAGA